MHRSNVDLPDPDRPKITTTSPACTSMSTPRSTSRAPKYLWRFSHADDGFAVRAHGPGSCGTPGWPDGAGISTTPAPPAGPAAAAAGRNWVRVPPRADVALVRT